MNTRKLIRCRDVMSDQFHVIDGLMTVQQALTIMQDNRADAIIVQKRDENDEFGIVLLVDIARKVLARDRAPERVNIYEIMTKPAMSVYPDMDVRYCARLFNRFGLSLAPVIDEGKVLGIVTYKALVLEGLTRLYGEE